MSSDRQLYGQAPFLTGTPFPFTAYDKVYLFSGEAVLRGPAYVFNADL